MEKLPKQLNAGRQEDQLALHTKNGRRVCESALAGFLFHSGSSRRWKGVGGLSCNEVTTKPVGNKVPMQIVSCPAKFYSEPE